jgi:drug/metabolite transporter (DMT)-like permease
VEDQLPYLLALLAALSFALGSTLQQRGALATPAEEGDPRFLAQILEQPAWLLGAGLQAAGWILQAAALNQGSLIVVQSLCTLSLVFALPLGARLTAQRVSRRSVAGAACTLVGIVAFLAVGQPQGGGSEPDRGSVVAWGVIVVVAILGLASLASRRRGPASAALFATAAGVSFGLQAAATKMFVGEVGNGLGAILSSPATYVLILTALVGFGLQQSALKTGFLAPAMAANSATTLATSVLFGIVLFGEMLAVDSGHLAFALLPLALAVAGVAILSAPEARDSGVMSPSEQPAG